MFGNSNSNNNTANAVPAAATITTTTTTNIMNPPNSALANTPLQSAQIPNSGTPVVFGLQDSNLAGLRNAAHLRQPAPVMAMGAINGQPQAFQVQAHQYQLQQMQLQQLQQQQLQQLQQRQLQQQQHQPHSPLQSLQQHQSLVHPPTPQNQPSQLPGQPIPTPGLPTSAQSFAYQ
ncbi:hypothetical protein BGZ70_001012, partial [Mortierella alpina]